MCAWWIKLYYLDCNDAQERKDEPYIVINGRREWGPQGMRTGDNKRLDGRRLEFDRSDAVTIQLREEDRGRDDLIGTRIVRYRDVRAWEESPSRPNLVFARSGRHFFGDARYTLWFALGYT